MPRGGKRPGAGAPKGNLNALKEGRTSPRILLLVFALLRVPLFRQFLLRQLAKKQKALKRRQRNQQLEALAHSIAAHAIASGIFKASRISAKRKSRGGSTPSGGGLGVSPSSFLFPLSIAEGEGETGGEGFGDSYLHNVNNQTGGETPNPQREVSPKTIISSCPQDNPSKKLSQNRWLRECRGGDAPSARGLGVSPRFLFLPRSLTKGAGDTGGEGFEIITK